MNTRLTRWFDLDQYPSRLDQERGRRFGVLLVVLPVVGIALLGIDLVVYVTNWAPVPAAGVLGMVWLVAVSGLSALLLRQGRLGLAVNVFLFGGFITTAVTLWPYGVTSALGAIIPITVLFVVIIAEWQGALFYTLAVVFYTLFAIWAESAGLLTPALTEAGPRMAVVALMLPIFCFLILGTAGALIGNLNQVTERAEGRLASAGLLYRLGERLAAAPDVRQLFDRAFDVVMDTYGQIELIRIYSLDREAETLTLVASSDAVDIDAVQSAKTWPADQAHKIGRVALSGQFALVSDMSQGEDLPDDQLLAGTRSYLVLPMMVGEALFGVMELQSSRPDDLTLDLVEGLQTMANLVTAAAERARQFRLMQERLDAGAREIGELKMRLARLQQAEALRTGQAWEAYLRDLDMDESLVLNLEDQNVWRDKQWTPALEQAVTQGDVVAVEGPAGPVVGVPIRVAGQVVGAMEFELDSLPSAQQREMARQVGERLGLAADSTRLFAEVQRIAAREVMVNAIGARLQSAHNDVDSALVTAAKGLSQVLRAPRVSVRIGLPEGWLPEPPPDEGGEG
ncbi:MAG: GAF domain-containing protein [Anaerolineae bacterium]|nr:GAF domain-containing protein [Anaerolineae bacterium]